MDTFYVFYISYIYETGKPSLLTDQTKYVIFLHTVWNHKTFHNHLSTFFLRAPQNPWTLTEYFYLTHIAVTFLASLKASRLSLNSKQDVSLTFLIRD